MKILVGKQRFTESNKPIMGYVAPESEAKCKPPYVLRRRRSPKLDDNWHPTGEEYEQWEVMLRVPLETFDRDGKPYFQMGEKSYFFDSLVEAEFAMEGSIGLTEAVKL